MILKEGNYCKRLDLGFILDNEDILDLHNHTTWSDGANSALEIIENAIKSGIGVIGLTDHLITYPDRLLDLDSYIKELLGLKEKYKGKIHVLLGLEISPFPFPKIFQDLEYEKINKLDYVLIEDLENTSKSIDLEALGRYINNFECLVGLAHTDLFKWCRNFDSLSILCSYISHKRMFWEINANSGHRFFDEVIYNDIGSVSLLELLHKYQIPVSAGSDTHSLDCYEYGRLVQANKVAGSFKYFTLIDKIKE